MPRRLLLTLAILSTLAGCDQLGLEAASVTAARVEADGKAVGAACRHGGRAIEDCFVLNKRVDKGAIYAGWREMDDYMRENKEEVVPATLSVAKKASDADGGDAGSSAKADDAAKPVDKPVDRTAKAAAPRPERIAKIDKSKVEKPVDKPVEH